VVALRKPGYTGPFGEGAMPETVVFTCAFRAPRLYLITAIGGMGLLIRRCQ